MALLAEKTVSGREYNEMGLTGVDFGRFDFDAGKLEMPRLMAYRAECGPAQQHFKGVGIIESINMAFQKWCTERGLEWSPGGGPYLIVNYSGYVTFPIHEGVKAEEEFQMVLGLSKESIKVGPLMYHMMKGILVGVSEETTTAVERLYQKQASWTLPFPAINVRDPFTKIKSDNLYGCRPSLPYGLMIAPDIIISVKVAVVCGYGDVGKGYAAPLKAAGARVIVTEIDPFLETPMEDLPGLTLEDVVGTVDIFVTATGNKYIIMVDDMRKMKNNSIVCNIAHFDNNFYMQGFEFKPQTDKWVFPDTNSGIIALSEGRLMNLGCATGHPNFVMSGSFTKKAAYVNVPVEGPYKTAQYRY